MVLCVCVVLFFVVLFFVVLFLFFQHSVQEPAGVLARCSPSHSVKLVQSGQCVFKPTIPTSSASQESGGRHSCDPHCTILAQGGVVHAHIQTASGLFGSYWTVWTFFSMSCVPFRFTSFDSFSVRAKIVQESCTLLMTTLLKDRKPSTCKLYKHTWHAVKRESFIPGNTLWHNFYPLLGPLSTKP